ncbi:MAG: hypothetical protein Q9160_000541 [Pyrenula sp. 1 TL-2023]
MDRLPVELISHILELLDARELLSLQTVSKQFLNLARENQLWRALCFDRSSRAQTRSWADTAAALAEGSTPSATLTADGQNVLHSIVNRSASTEHHTLPGHTKASQNDAHQRDLLLSPRARAIASWDPSYRSEGILEEVDWYSEYVGRHGQLAMRWLPQDDRTLEARGMAIKHQSGAQKVVSPLENGSVAIWHVGDPEEFSSAPPHVSTPGMLFPRSISHGGSSSVTFADKVIEFGGDITECVSIANHSDRAFFASSDAVTEVDLSTFQIISQQKFAWNVTALSRTTLPESPDTIAIGTRHSLHLHDSRTPSLIGATSSSEPEDKIAFIPNVGKPVRFGLSRLNDPTRSLTVMRTGDPGEPGPVSILPLEDTLFVAGRFPSILRYDRRFFPKLEDTIHSGGRLAGLAHIPIPANGGEEDLSNTLIACGEYGGRGSLELYPFSETTLLSSNASRQSRQTKNRQTASSAKLLSVATQGTRIVFSDADGGLKWVERDGYSVVRRWNINHYSMIEPSRDSGYGSRILEAGIEGTDVVRKLLPFHSPWQSDHGTRGDSPLLIWTGEKIGVVTNRPSTVDNLMTSDDNVTPKQHDGEKEHEYEAGMRRALQRQAEEVNWLWRFGSGR